MAPPLPDDSQLPTTLEEALEVIREQRRQVVELHAIVVDQDQAIAALTKRLEELEKGGKKPPPWVKPNTKKRRKKKGPPKGHKGARRKDSSQCGDLPQETHLHDGPCCPDCGHDLGPTVEVQNKQDIEIQLVQAVHRLHEFHRRYCPGCKRLVRSAQGAVVPRSDYGPNVHGLLAYLKYGLGMTLGKVQALMARAYGVRLSTGTISEILLRLGARAEGLYERMRQGLTRESMLHADETSWRVEGQNHWLWCFGNHDVVVYHIDPSRGAKVVEAMLGNRFDGVLCTDFYAAYGAINSRKQKCLVHLLRDVRKLRDDQPDDPEVQRFCVKLISLVRRGFKLKAGRKGVDEELFKVQVKRYITTFSNAFVGKRFEHPDCQRLAKRITKFRREIFVFLEVDEVLPHNNPGELMIRPAVLMRKTSYGNRSDRGRRAQQIFMSLIRTLELRGLDFIRFAAQLAAWDPRAGPLELPEANTTTAN